MSAKTTGSTKVDASDLFEKMLQSIMSTDDYVKREAYIRKNVKYVIPLVRWLTKVVVSFEQEQNTSSAGPHESKKTRPNDEDEDEDSERVTLSEKEENNFALFSLNCLLFISSAATSSETDSDTNSLADVFTEKAQSDFLYHLNYRILNGRATDSHLGVLVNLTRYPPVVDRLVENVFPRLEEGSEGSFIPKLVSFLRAPEVQDERITNFNSRQLISAYLTNLTQAEAVRKLIVQQKLIPILLSIYESKRISLEVKKAAVSVIRNCCFDTATHRQLLSSDESSDPKENELLVKLVLPLAGPAEIEDHFTEAEIERLPIDLQYLPASKRREPSVEIRQLFLETLLQLCSTRYGRTVIRDSDIYLILREYHKWETNGPAMLSLENLIDVLIKTEEELYHYDNLKEEVEISDELMTKFDRMDKQMLEDVAKETANLPAIEDKN